MPAKSPWRVAVVMGLFSLPFFMLGYVVSQKGDETRWWPSVPGKIITSMSVAKAPEGGRGLSASRDYAYYPRWEYEYTVEGERLTASRIQHGQGVRGYKRREAADRAATARFPVGSRVTVYFDPENPKDATLNRGGSRTGVFALVGTGLFSIVLGLLFSFAMWKHAKDNPEAYPKGSRS